MTTTSLKRNGLIAGTGGVLLLAVLVAFWFCFRLLSPDVGDLISAAMHNDEAKMTRCLQRGVKVNTKEKWGWHRENEGRTPLTAAVEWGNASTIRWLISAGADVNFPDGWGASPACIAAQRGDAEIIRLLAASDADFRVMHEKKTPREIAINSGHKEAAGEIEKILAAAGRK